MLPTPALPATNPQGVQHPQWWRNYHDIQQQRPSCSSTTLQMMHSARRKKGISTWIKNNHFDLSDLREGPHTMRCNAGFEDGMQSSHLPIIAKSTATIPLPTLHPPITPLQVRFMPLTISHNRIQYYSQWNHIEEKQDEGTTYTREVLSGICAGMSVKPDINQQAAHTNAGTMDTSGVLHDTTTAPTTPATKNTPV